MGARKAKMRTTRETGQHKLPGFCVFTLLLFFGSHPAFATIDNTAVAVGEYLGAPTASAGSTVNVPVTPATESMAVTKTANDTTDVVAGQVITYTYTIRNTGTVTLTNVSLGENHNGTNVGGAPVPGSEIISIDVGPSGDSSDATVNDGVWSVLAPGDTVQFTATYAVVQTDVDNRQ
jgi:large repetitive protein